MSNKDNKGNKKDSYLKRVLTSAAAYLRYFELDVYFREYVTTPLIKNIETELFANLGPIEENVKDQVRNSLRVIISDVIQEEMKILNNPALNGSLKAKQINEIEAKVTQSLSVISKDILNITDIFMNKEIGLVDEFAKTLLDNAEKGMGYTVVAIPFLGDIVAVAKLLRTYFETVEKVKKQVNEAENTFVNTKKKVEEATTIPSLSSVKLPKVQKVPEVPKVPKVPEVPKVPKVPEVSKHTTNSTSKGGSNNITITQLSGHLNTLRNQVQQTGGRIQGAKKEFFAGGKTRTKRVRR